MPETMRLDLPMLLPGVEDAQDACIGRLITLVTAQAGVTRVHVTRADSAVTHETDEPQGRVPAAEALLCLHYDPEQVTLQTLQQIARSAGAEVTARFAHAVLPLDVIGSEDSGRRLEAELRAVEGVTAAVANVPAQVMRVEYDRTRISEQDVTRRLRELGAAPDATQPSDVSVSWYARYTELAWSLGAGMFLLIGWSLMRVGDVPRGLVIACFVAAYTLGALDNVGHLLKDLRKGHVHFDIDLLMVVAALGAAIIGEWVDGALLLFLFSLGHALEHYALGRARNAIAALSALTPTRATVIREGAAGRTEEDVPVETVRLGERVVIKPASRLPVDGTVESGTSAVNQAPVTGESVPVEKSAGAPVYAGSVNGEGALVVVVTAVVGDRTLDRVVKLVAEAETQKAPTQRFTDRFEQVFVPLVLVADVAIIVVPSLMGWWTWTESFYRGMALLVAASPCALALGTPAAVLAGIAQAARHGVLIKGGAHLESLGSIDTLALDKTGTITRGTPAVTSLLPSDGVAETELLRVAAAVEQRSQHPLAKAIMDAVRARAIDVPPAADVTSVTGRGLRSVVEGLQVDVGRLLMFEDQPTEAAAVPASVRDGVERLELSGQTTMVVRRGTEWLGVIGIADEPRADVRGTLARLRAVGIKRIVMLTGDNAGVGQAVGRAVGIDDVRAGLMPEDKVTAITELSAKGRVAMVGDGVNDAPALARASVGIAMGGAGTAAALETADVALMGDDLGRLPFAIGLSRQTKRVITQNLVLSLGVIAVLVVATISGLLRIGPTVVVHEGSTLVVIVNALRLLRYREVGGAA